MFCEPDWLSSLSSDWKLDSKPDSFFVVVVAVVFVL